MANHFGGRFMSGAGRKPSGDGADLEFSNGRAYESKSEVKYKGGKPYQLFKEFTSGPKGLGTKLQADGFAWASQTEDPATIKSGIKSLSTSKWKKFKSIVETHIEDEGLLVPNYTNGTIYGATNTEVVADWKAATTSPSKNKLAVAQYSPKRRGFTFPVNTAIVGKNASISSSLMSARNELLDKARAEGFDLGKLIKKVFPTKEKWEDYFDSLGKNPPNYATAINSNHGPNQNTDIRAFGVKKKTGKFISFGNYKHLGASQMQGGGQGDIAYSTLLTHADGDGSKDKTKKSTKATGMNQTKYKKLVSKHINKELGRPTSDSAAGLSIKYGGEESRVTAFVRAKFKAGEQDLLSQICAKEVAIEVKHGDGSSWTSIATTPKKRGKADKKDPSLTLKFMWAEIKKLGKVVDVQKKFKLVKSPRYRATTAKMKTYYEFAIGGGSLGPGPKKDKKGKKDPTGSKIARPYSSKKASDVEMTKHKARSRSGIWKRRGLDKFGGSNKNKWDAQDLYVSSRKNNKARPRDDAKGKWAFEGNYSLVDKLLTESSPELIDGIDAALELMQTYGSNAYNIDDAIADLETDGLGAELAQIDSEEDSAVDYDTEPTTQGVTSIGNRPPSFNAM
jgi:hypothetical protein